MKKANVILQKKVEMYRAQIHSSTFTPVEAYCCYKQYTQPSLTYPLPCTYLTYQQCRQIGSTTLFFQLPYPRYENWVDHTWITSIWKFTHQAKLSLKKTTMDTKAQLHWRCGIDGHFPTIKFLLPAATVNQYMPVIPKSHHTE